MPGGLEDVTLGEVYRNVTSLREEIRHGVSSVNARIDRLEFVPKGEYVEARNAFEDRIAKLENARDWLIRAVGGFVVSGILAAVFISRGGV